METLQDIVRDLDGTTEPAVSLGRTKKGPPMIAHRTDQRQNTFGLNADHNITNQLLYRQASGRIHQERKTPTMYLDGGALTAASPSTESPHISPEAQQIDLLDMVMHFPGAQAYHYLVVRHLLTTELPLEAFTLNELCEITGMGFSTVKEMKRWFVEHGVLTRIQEVINSSQNIGSWDGKDLKKLSVIEEEQNNHGPEFRLCVEKLEEIGWGVKNGYRVQDPDVFIRRFGARNILYAIWCAGGKGIKNKAAFVSWQLYGKDIKAPEGWKYPHPPVDTSQETVEDCSRRMELVQRVSQAEEELNSDVVAQERLRKRETGQHFLTSVLHDVLLDYNQYLLHLILQRMVA